METLPMAILLFPCAPLWCADWKSIQRTIESRIVVVTDRNIYQRQTTHSLCGAQEVSAYQLPQIKVLTTGGDKNFGSLPYLSHIYPSYSNASKKQEIRVNINIG